MKPRTYLRLVYAKHQCFIDLALVVTTALTLLAGIYLCAYFGAEIDAFFLKAQY